MKKYLLPLFLLLVWPTQGSAQLFNCGQAGGAYFRSMAPSGLLLRDEPSQGARKITVMPHGDLVYSCNACYHCPADTIEGIVGVWKRVFYGAYEGFAFSGFLQPEPVISVLRPAEWSVSPDAPRLQEELVYFGIYADQYSPRQSVAKIFNRQDTAYFNPANVAVPGAKVSDGPNPGFIVSGLPNLRSRQVLEGMHLADKMLYPGESVYFKNAIIYATGDPQSTADDFHPFNSIRNYRLIIRQREAIGESFQEQVLFEFDIFKWAGGGYEGGVRLFWVGDLDGDGKLDVLLSHSEHFACYDVILLLSSKAMSNQLLGEGTKYVVCTC